MKSFGGFTLVEVLVTLAIVGILTSVAIPNFADTIGQQKIKQSAENLASYLRRVQVASIQAAAPATATISASGVTVSGVGTKPFSSDMPDGITIQGRTTYVFESDGRASSNGTTTIGARGTSKTKVLTVTPVGQVVVD